MDNSAKIKKFERLENGNTELPPDGRALDKGKKEASKASKASKKGEKKDGKDATDAKKKVLSKKQDDRTTAQKLMAIVDNWHFFKDSSGTAWAKIDGRCYKVKSTPFKRHLQREYYLTHNKTPYSQALQDVIDQSEMIGLFESNIEDINVRVAKTGSKIIIDRLDGQIEIIPSQWTECNSSSANFWQPQGLNTLPAPKNRGDGIEMLKDYLNYETEEDFMLMVGWMLTAYNPEIPCPIINFQGEQGSAKTTNSKVIRSLIDPSGAMITPAPREERTLVIMAQNSRVLCLDNLSGLKKWLSDALCRICTGTGLSTRRLYTNDEQQIFQVKRPIILNGIDDIATRGDLLDRSIILTLPTIDPEDHKDERDFWRSFYQDRPYILASLYNALAAGLVADRPPIKELPRMADFAEWVTRCATGLKWDDRAIFNAYNSNKDNAIEAGLDGDYLAIAIRKILKEENSYKGTPTALVEKLREVSAESSHKYLPTTRTLKDKLRRLGPNLRKIGIDWDYDSTGDERTYILEEVQNKASKASKASTSNEELPF